MLHQSFGKIFALVTALSLIAVGIAPANPKCTAECCMQPAQPAFSESTMSTHADLVSDCCSDLQSLPCPNMLESSNESKDYALFAAAPQLNLTTGKIAATLNGSVFLSQSPLYVFSSSEPHIRGPSTPLYLQNQSFLI